MDKEKIKNQVSQQVKWAVQSMFEHSLEESVTLIGNVTLKYKHHLDEDKYKITEHYIEVWNDDMYIKSFPFDLYAGNGWEFVSTPWIWDLINDITKVVMNQIQEFYSKEEGIFIPIEFFKIEEITNTEAAVLSIYRMYSMDDEQFCCTLSNDEICKLTRTNESELRKIKEHLEELDYICTYDDDVTVAYIGVDCDQLPYYFL